MTPCPAIVTYLQQSGEPLARPFIARFVDSTEAGRFLPIFFAGRTMADVEQNALDWWADEQRKIEARKAKIVKMQAGRGRSERAA